MDPEIPFAFLPFLLGILIIFGTLRRWKWLVEPPADNWIFGMFYPLVFVKKQFGKTFIIYWNYFIGVFLILISLFGIWYAIKTGHLDIFL